jgi:hypothetical protein
MDWRRRREREREKQKQTLIQMCDSNSGRLATWKKTFTSSWRIKWRRFCGIGVEIKQVVYDVNRNVLRKEQRQKVSRERKLPLTEIYDENIKKKH